MWESCAITAPMPHPQASEDPSAGLPRGPLQGRAALARAATVLLDSARREVRLFAPQLDAALFGTGAVTGAMARFLMQHPRNRLRLLLEDEAQVRRDHERLFELARRLADRLALRVVDQADRGAVELYLVVDRAAALRQDDLAREEGRAIAAPIEAVRLAERFDAAWERAQPLAPGTLGLGS